MLSKEQIEQIVQATIAQMNNQQTASASAPAGAAATADITGRALLVSVIIMDARGCRVATRIKVSWAA